MTVITRRYKQTLWWVEALSIWDVGSCSFDVTVPALIGHTYTVVCKLNIQSGLQILYRNQQPPRLSLHPPTTMRPPLIHEILPYDIFTVIFDHCCKNDLPHAAFRLEVVCKRWREIVLDMPWLWSTMTLEVGKSGKQFSDVQESAIKWLNRSEGAPFELIVICNQDTSIADLAIFTAFMPPLYTRLGSLEIHGTSAVVRKMYQLSPATLVFPLLKSLKIKMYSNRWGFKGSFTLQDPLVRALSQYPSLKSLTLEGTCLFNYLCHWEQLAPWSQLTVLSLKEDISYNRFVRLLAACPKLVTCHVDVGEDRDGFPPGDGHIRLTPRRHAHLKCLSLGNTRLLELALRLWTRLPSLESLTSSGIFSTDRTLSLPISLCTLFRAERFPLREISLSRDAGRTADFLKFLSCVPTLEKLELYHTGLLGDTLFTDSIAIDDTKDDNLVPRLAYFTIVETSIGSPESLYRFVCTRLRDSTKCSALRHVYVGGGQLLFDEVTREKIEGLAHEGLYVSMNAGRGRLQPARNVSRMNTAVPYELASVFM